MPFMSRKKFIAYGTLKHGFYNFDRFPGMEYHKDITIKGFKMYSLGPYPTCFKTNNEDDEVMAQIISAPEDVFNSIVRMELGAGYQIDNIEHSGEKYPIFVYPPVVLKQFENKESIREWI
jgi:gamma-glutamylcyclotransferase (GGCT)/AIG2-like uncharacterized protein YtfP